MKWLEMCLGQCVQTHWRTKNVPKGLQGFKRQWINTGERILVVRRQEHRVLDDQV